MSLYYQHMQTYMGPALFGITVEAMKSMEDEIALQGIEFWSTVGEEEMDIAIEAADAEDKQQAPPRESRHFAKGKINTYRYLCQCEFFIALLSWILVCLVSACV